MTDQHPGYREDWDITSEAGSLCFASAIYSRLVGGEQDEATFQWLAKYLRANAAPQHISAMTDQHQHRATPEQWAKVKGYAPGLEVCSCLIELRDRIQLLEATQHAHIEAKASEAGARCAVEQLRSKPGSWQPIKTETTYGSDATTPELSQSDVKAAEMEWARTAPGMRSDATDQVLALQDQIRDGSLTLPEALKKINGDDQPVQQFIAKYLFTAGNIQQDSFCYDPSDSNSVSFDIAKFEPVNGCLKPGDGIKIAHRWGELPASDVYSTINYKVVSVSETENRAWTIRAVRVGTSDSEPAPTADDLDAVAAAGAQVGRSSAAVDQVLALQDQIRDGSLSLADALKEIGASEPAKDPFRRPSLADTLADTHHCSFFNTSVLIRAFKDWLTQEGKAPLAMRELLEAQAQIAESDPHA
jgi:hypothetical protein